LHRLHTGQLSSASESKHAPPPRALRKNLLLSATIEGGGITGPVLIRNLSDGGAMVEGAPLPERGTRTLLRRQELHSDAVVMWRDGRRCGLRFDGAISVEAWVAGVANVPARILRTQGGVDQLQSLIRQGRDFCTDETAPSGATTSPALLFDRLIDELKDVGRVLQDFGETLVEDPAVAGRHAEGLQNLELTRQRLDELIAVIAARDTVAAAGRVAVHDLKARLLRA
jgi:hypothetical protein